MNQQQPQQRPSAPYSGQRRPPQSPQQTRPRPPQGNVGGYPPQSYPSQSAYPGYPPQAQNRRPPQQSGFGYPPQTINRTPRPYGETGPARRPDGVRMQVQCCVPAKRRRAKRGGGLRILALILALLLVVAGIVTGVILYRRAEAARALAEQVRNDAQPKPEQLAGPPTTTAPPVTTEPPVTEPPGPKAIIATSSAATLPPVDRVEAPYAFVMDVASGTAVAERLPDTRIYPASMTKVMTLIVAYEELESFDATYTFDYTLINPLVEANASRAGFCVGETVPVIDLFYGAALPSGGDATAALACLVAGSESAFADRMNAKAAEMGLIGTHFVNASGLHDDNHYSTLREIAAIFAYAMQIEPLREILSTYQYTTAKTKQNPEGLLLTSTLFNNVSGDELPGMRIVAGKTGFTYEAKRCLVSMALDDTGREYIAVIVGGANQWVPITDSVELYAMCLGRTAT